MRSRRLDQKQYAWQKKDDKLSLDSTIGYWPDHVQYTAPHTRLSGRLITWRNTIQQQINHTFTREIASKAGNTGGYLKIPEGY